MQTDHRLRGDDDLPPVHAVGDDPAVEAEEQEGQGRDDIQRADRQRRGGEREDHQRGGGVLHPAAGEGDDLAGPVALERTALQRLRQLHVLKREPGRKQRQPARLARRGRGPEAPGRRCWRAGFRIVIRRHGRPIPSLQIALEVLRGRPRRQPAHRGRWVILQDLPGAGEWPAHHPKGRTKRRADPTRWDA